MAAKLTSSFIKKVLGLRLPNQRVSAQIMTCPSCLPLLLVTCCMGRKFIELKAAFPSTVCKLRSLAVLIKNGLKFMDKPLTILMVFVCLTLMFFAYVKHSQE